MSRFNAYRNNLPDGCSDADGGASDVYVCVSCGGEFSQAELDDEASEAFAPVCKECAHESEDDE